MLETFGFGALEDRSIYKSMTPRLYKWLTFDPGFPERELTGLKPSRKFPTRSLKHVSIILSRERVEVDYLMWTLANTCSSINTRESLQ